MKTFAHRTSGKILLSAIVAASLASSASAATITWGGVAAISGNATTTTDVVTTGDLDRAINFGSTLSTTVSGVLFDGWSGENTFGDSITQGDNTLTSKLNGTPSPTGWTNFDSSGNGAPYTNLENGYQVLLGSSVFANGGGIVSPLGTVTLTLNGLTDGHEYLFQGWFNDSRAGSSPLSQTYTGSAGSNFGRTAPGGDAGLTGTFQTGTFTAIGTSQDVEWTGDQFTYGTAFQLRVVAVPEPSSVVSVLLLSSMAALAVIHRRRRA